MTDTERDAAIEEVRDSLIIRASPRRHMSAIIAASGGLGFLASYLLLRGGLTTMALRYPIAVAVGYLAFLGLLRLWLGRYRLRIAHGGAASGRDDPSWSPLDVVDVPLRVVGRSGARGGGFSGFGGGGGSAGGGAGRTFDAAGQLSRAAAQPAVQPAMPLPRPSSSGGPGGHFGLDLDSLDEGAWVLIPLTIAAILALGAALYVVLIAPSLLAELLLDAALSAGLYHRVQGVRGQHWLRSAVRHTVIPALFVAVLLTAAGYAMQLAYPDAVSIGRVWERATHSREAR